MLQKMKIWRVLKNQTRMYGNECGDPDSTDVYSIYESDDNFTTTMNYQQNSIEFNSKRKEA